MKKIEKIVKELDYNLDFLEKETEGVLEKAEESIRITKRALEQIRILFFKEKINPEKRRDWFFQKH
ncbi:hypothetical protein [Polaribacter marinaquae]|uniref:Uncharacterized protein n=1 Tax=Polaribacter marinaquae TaxID=1642819 RepID=A0ABZ2TUC0_9FLAO